MTTRTETIEQPVLVSLKDNFTKQSSESFKKFKAAAKVAFLAATAAAVLFAKKILDAATKIEQMSTRLGVSTESLSQYRRVAEQANISFDALAISLQRMTRRVAEAASGTGEAVNALDELNLNAKELNKLKPDQQYEIIADALNGLESQADKVRIAFKLFDTEGVGLLQTMENGSEGIRELKEEADKLGLTLTKEQIEKLDRLSGAWATLGDLLTGIGQNVLLHFAGFFTDIADAMVETGLQAKSFFNETFKKGIIPIVVFLNELIVGLADGMASLAEKAATLAPALEPNAKAMRSVADGLSDGLDRLKDFQKKLEETPDIVIKVSKEVDKLATSFKGVAIGIDIVDIKLSENRDSFDNWNRISDAAITSMEQGITEGIMNMKAGLSGFSSFAMQMLQAVLKEIVRVQVSMKIARGITSFAAGLFSPSTPNDNGFVNDPTSVFHGQAQLSVGARAGGGGVGSGQSFLVGERGPEILTMGKQSGQITPNSGIGGTTILIDLRGAHGDESLMNLVKKGIAQAAPQLVNASVKQVKTDRQRDPKFFQR